MRFTSLFVRATQLLITSSCTLVLPTYVAAQPHNSPKRVYPGQEIVVSFPSQTNGFAARASAKVKGLKLAQGTKLTKSLSDGRLGVISSSSSLGAKSAEPVEANEAEIKALCDAIKASNPGEEITCEANTIIETNRTPNDTQYSSLWGMPIINAPAAWDITTGSSSVVVAVIDTGIDYTHPDLADNIATNSGEIPGNGVDDDNNGFTDDYYGYDFINGDSNPIDDHFHGTHCAGTIGAKGDNSRGVAGVAWSVKLLPVKVLDSYGSGSLASVAAGMNYAVKRGVKIMSMSLGTSSYSSTLENALIAAKNAGVLVVAAAGNDGHNSDVYPHYPSASTQPNVLSIAASNSTDTLAYFSNWGRVSVDLAAPGQSILSTYLGGQYAYASGTSMATPHVAGMAAMLLAVNPSLTYSQMKDILISTVDPIPAMAGTMVSGGRANLYKAVVKAREGVATPTPAPTSTPMPTATATPTPAPTQPAYPTETPAPTPPPMETPPQDDPNSISISLDRTRSKVFIFGEIFTSADAPVVGETVELYCGGRSAGTKTTDSEGYYEFVFKRPKRPIRCYTQDSNGDRSRRITVR